jgi:fatty acid desaturase
MNPETAPEPKKFFQGKAGLLVTALVVAILLIGLPAYRWFFVISVAIGLAIAAGLTLWHKLRPLKEEDVVKKRPLGL